VHQQRFVDVTPESNALKLKVSGQPGGVDRIGLAKAEEALRDLGKNVGRSIEDELDKLSVVRDRIHVEGYNRETAQILSIRVNEIRGLAKAYDDPTLAAIAGSLQSVIGDARTCLREPLHILDVHIACVRAAMQSKVGEPDNDAADALLADLTKRVRTHLSR
jgi:hypothetical protein